MSKVMITPLHCVDCAADLMKRLENASGLQGFSYDGDHNTLTFPEGTDKDKLERVLNADKIFIRQDEATDHEEALIIQKSSKVPIHDKNHDVDHAKNHGHDHSHDHGHNHSRGGHLSNLKETSSEKNILLVFVLNLVFSIMEFIAGIMLNSTSIFTDAIHDFGDALSVGLAWIFEKLSLRHSDRQFTFGHRRFSLLGALITGTFLIVGSLISLSRAIPRLLSPEEVNYSGMLYLSIAAIIINGAAAWLLMGRRSKNESILTVHMLEDLLGWVGILIISIILHFKPWYFLDPIVSVLIALYILKEAVPQTVDTIKILLESVPEGADISELEKGILGVKGVHGLSHLHFWSMDGEENTFAVTLFTKAADPLEQQRIRREVQSLLAPRGVNCSTIEIDYDPEGLIQGRN